MLDKVMAELQSRVNEIRELLHQMDSSAARQMEQEMDRIQEIIDALQSKEPI